MVASQTTLTAVEGDLPSVHGNVLEATYHQIALGIQGPSGIVCRQLEGFQFLRQGYDKKRERIITKNMREQNDRGTGFLLRILPVTLASKSTSHAQTKLLSPP